MSEENPDVPPAAEETQDPVTDVDQGEQNADNGQPDPENGDVTETGEAGEAAPADNDNTNNNEESAAMEDAENKEEEQDTENVAEEPSAEVPAAEESPAEVPAAEEAPSADDAPSAGETPAEQPATEGSAVAQSVEQEGDAGETAGAEPTSAEGQADEAAAVEDNKDVSQGDNQVAADEPQQSEGNPEEQAENAQEEAQPEPAIEPLEEKKTPEPPTENMGTGTDEKNVETPRDVFQGEPQVVQRSTDGLSYDKDATATVKFVLMPTQQVATLRCSLSQSLAELKKHFAQELKMPQQAILLMFDGKAAEDTVALGELGVGPNGTIQLEMQSADPVNVPIKPFRPRQEYHMPDVITVRVQSEDGFKDVVVEIERTTAKKPFLGGYRHKKTSTEYHHASAQTMQKPRQQTNVERYCRDTQTTQQKHMVQQTTNDMSTQMNKVGVYVSNMEDKLVVPGKYTTADEFHSNVLNRVIIIQKYYRRWLAKNYVVKVRDDKQQRLEWERQEEMRKKKEKEDRIKREFERRMNPKSKEDFDLLYHALEKWRQEELDRINSELTGAERKAALCQLLDQETQLISSVGRHKNEANGENKQKTIQKFLDQAASPKKWKGSDGKVTEMDTPYTIRAQELRDIYNSINMKYLTQDERLDVLLTLKHTVKEHDCKLTHEIIELIDREADLLMRGVREGNLDGLRKRISTLFLQYTKTPTFNPEAARLLKVPQDPSTLRKNIYFCSSCNQYLPSTEFQLSSNSKAVGKCRKCNMIDNDARVRQDYSHYRYMLKGLRKQEEVYGDGSKIAFLMQENDLRYLVENVWNSQSVLSAWDDLYDLTLVRWDKHEEWSPWNCILLTKEEASAHDKLENLPEAYGKVFIHKVKHKHTLARNYFSRLPGMSEHIRAKGSSSAKSNGPSVLGKGLVPARA